jgi:hypothetical protein
MGRMTTIPAPTLNFQPGQVLARRVAETMHYYRLSQPLTAPTNQGVSVWAARWVTVHTPTGERDERGSTCVPSRLVADGFKVMAGTCSGYYGDRCAVCDGRA